MCPDNIFICPDFEILSGSLLNERSGFIDGTFESKSNEGEFCNLSLS